MQRIVVSAVLWAVLVVQVLFAQSEVSDRSAVVDRQLPITVGVYAGFGIHYYFGSVDLADGSSLIGAGSCGVLNNGTGTGVAPGIFGEYRISPDLSLGFRLLHEGKAGVMTTESGESDFRQPGGDLTPVESEHQLDVDLSVVSVEMYAAFQPFDFPLIVTAGPKISIPFTSDFILQEELNAPGDVTFDNGTQTREFNSGDLETGPLIGLVAGLGYPLPMGGGLELVPEVSLSSYITSITDAGSALIATVRPSFSVRYTFPKPKPAPPLPPPGEPAPPPAPPIPTLTASAQAYGISPDGSSVNDVVVVSRERVRTREFAVLPYIFFAENSAEIPARYKRVRNEGNADNALEGYRNILNRLGRGLMANPAANITLVGTNAGGVEEEAGLELSRNRAEAVKRYLTSQWNIRPDRIAVQARGLPENPSNSNFPEGREENRRVEVVTEEGVLSSIVAEDTIRSLTSSGVRFAGDVRADAGYDEWEITARIGRKPVRRLNGTEVLKKQIEDTFTEDELQLLASGNQSIVYSMTVVDEAGQRFQTEEKVIGVLVQRVRENDLFLGDSVVSFDNVVVFPYNSAEIDDEDRASLLRLKRQLPENAALTITGFADDIGNSDYNQRLSRRRAEAVARLFGEYPVAVAGAGESSSADTSATPEERFYSRTVTVTVQAARLQEGEQIP